MSVNVNFAVATKLRSITKNDSTVVNCQALYVGTGGDVAILADGDSAAVTLTNVPTGSILPIACNKVMSTNTTASGFVGLYI